MACNHSKTIAQILKIEIKLANSFFLSFEPSLCLLPPAAKKKGADFKTSSPRHEFSESRKEKSVLTRHMGAQTANWITSRKSCRRGSMLAENSTHILLTKGPSLAEYSTLTLLMKEPISAPFSLNFLRICLGCLIRVIQKFQFSQGALHFFHLHWCRSA